MTRSPSRRPGRPAGAAALLALALALAAPLAARAQGWSPDNFIASGDNCRAAGARRGRAAGAEACSVARSACGAPRMAGSGAPAGGIGAVSLPQCANIAYGACQADAAPGRSPCAREAALGFGSCDARAFASIYAGAMGRACYAAAQTVSGVDPGTNQWAPVPGRVPAVVSPGSVVGQGVGSAIGSAIGGGPGVISSVAGSIGARIGNSVDTTVANAIFGRRLLRA